MGRRRAIVDGAASPCRGRCDPGIRAAPRPWIPASAGTTVWCGFRIKSGTTGGPSDRAIFVPKTETVRKDGLDPTAEEIGVVTREYQERQWLLMLDAGRQSRIDRSGFGFVGE